MHRSRNLPPFHNVWCTASDVDGSRHPVVERAVAEWGHALDGVLMKQGIRLHWSGYRHPQTQGKVERFHGALQRALQFDRCRASSRKPGWISFAGKPRSFWTTMMVVTVLMCPAVSRVIRADSLSRKGLVGEIDLDELRGP